MVRPWKSYEDLLSEALNQYCALMLKPNVIYFHVPNEGKRSPAYGKKLKDMGLKAGVFDWWFIEPQTQIARCMELKANKNKLTPTQIDFKTKCDDAGVDYAVCYNLEECEASLKAWGLVK